MNETHAARLKKEISASVHSAVARLDATEREPRSDLDEAFADAILDLTDAILTLCSYVDELVTPEQETA